MIWIQSAQFKKAGLYHLEGLDRQKAGPLISNGCIGSNAKQFAMRANVQSSQKSNSPSRKLLNPRSGFSQGFWQMKKILVDFCERSNQKVERERSICTVLTGPRVRQGGPVRWVRRRTLGFTNILREGGSEAGREGQRRFSIFFSWYLTGFCDHDDVALRGSNWSVIISRRSEARDENFLCSEATEHKDRELQRPPTSSFLLSCSFQCCNNEMETPRTKKLCFL